MALKSASLFSPVVLIQLNISKATDSKELLDSVLAWLVKPSTDTILVLSINSKAPLELIKQVRKYNGEVFTFSTPVNLKERKALVLKKAGEKQINFALEAIDLLLETLGESLEDLDSVLDLASLCYKNTLITKEIVQDLVYQKGLVPLWELTDAIDKQDVLLSLSTLQRLLAFGKAPVMLHVVLQGHFEKMFKAISSGLKTENEVAELLGIKGSTYPAKKALYKGKIYGEENLIFAMELLSKAASDLRGSSAISPQLLLEVLVARLAKIK